MILRPLRNVRWKSSALMVDYHWNKFIAPPPLCETNNYLTEAIFLNKSLHDASTPLSDLSSSETDITSYICYNSLIKNFAKSMEIPNLNAYIEKAYLMNVIIDGDTRCAAIRAFIAAKQPERIRAQVDQLREYDASLDFSNAVIDAYAQAGNIEMVTHHTEIMKLAGIIPNTQTHVAWMKCYLERHLTKSARFVIMQANQRKERVAPEMLRCLLQYMCIHKRYDKALRAFGLFSLYRCNPSIEDYNMIMQSAAKWNELGELNKHRKELEYRKIELNLETYRILLIAYSKLGLDRMMMLVFKKLSGSTMNQDIEIWNLLLKGMILRPVKRNIDIAIQVWRALAFGIAPTPTSSIQNIPMLDPSAETYMLAFQVCLRGRFWQDRDRIIEETRSNPNVDLHSVTEEYKDFYTSTGIVFDDSFAYEMLAMRKSLKQQLPPMLENPRDIQVRRMLERHVQEQRIN